MGALDDGFTQKNGRIGMDVSMPVYGITPSRYGRARKTRARIPPPATKECGCNLTVGKPLMKNAKVYIFYLYTIDKTPLPEPLLVLPLHGLTLYRMELGVFPQ